MDIGEPAVREASSASSSLGFDGLHNVQTTAPPVVLMWSPLRPTSRHQQASSSSTGPCATVRAVALASGSVARDRSAPPQARSGRCDVMSGRRHASDAGVPRCPQPTRLARCRGLNSADLTHATRTLTDE